MVVEFREAEKNGDTDAEEIRAKVEVLELIMQLALQENARWIALILPVPITLDSRIKVLASGTDSNPDQMAVH
jgi:hypothetical protein